MLLAGSSGAAVSIMDLPVPVLRGRGFVLQAPTAEANSLEYQRYISTGSTDFNDGPRDLRGVVIPWHGGRPAVTTQASAPEGAWPSRIRHARAIEKRVDQIHRRGNPYMRRMQDEEEEDEEVTDYGKQYETYTAMLSGKRNPWTGELEGPAQELHGADYVYGELVYPLDGNISFRDLKVLRGVLDSVGGMYNYYYEIMPKKEVTQAKKDMWDKAYDMGQFYVKIRTFVLLVKNDRKRLFSELAYLNGKVAQLKVTEDDMLSFYGVTVRYEKAKVRASPYVGRDPKFNTFFGFVRGVTGEFSTGVKSIAQGCYDLSTLNFFFQNQIDSLLARSSDNAVINALIKADQVIMLLARIIEIKNDFATSIQGIKNGLKAIESTRSAISNNITAIENLALYYRQSDARKSAPVWTTCLALLLAVLVLF